MIPLRLLVLIPLLAYMPSDQDTPFHWNEVGQRIEIAFYSDNPDSAFTVLNSEIEKRGIKSDPHMDSYILEELKECQEFYNTMSDDIRALYKQELAFRQLSKKDTTIVSHFDFTGDGVQETQFTIIRKDKDIVMVDYVITSGLDTLESTSDPAMPGAPTWSPCFEQIESFYFAAEHAPPSGRLKEPIYYFQFPDQMASKVSASTGESIDELIPKLREYLENFEGDLFEWHPNTFGALYVWYKPLNKFVLLYTP